MSRVKLSDVCEIVNGATPKRSNPEYWDGDIKWITPAELSSDVMYVDDTKNKITEAGFNSVSLRLMPAGTVLLSSRAPIGKVAIIAEPMCCNQGFKNFICTDKICNRYLYRFLQSHTEQLQAMGHGATFKEISKSSIGGFEISLPSIQQQMKVADHFDALDGQKNLYRNQIQILNELVKSRFIEMFEKKKKNPNNWPVRHFSDFAVIDTHMTNDFEKIASL